MVVVPTSTHVELHYGFTPVDNAGRLASVLGLGVVATWWWWDHRSETIVDHEEEDEEHQDDLVDAGGSDSW
jgi:hypothetical protein